ncbi:MAG: tRNA (guanosine(46)-N7)-methyltransferase TrmB [Gammaproteobacteria bacterium]|nr:tRNA (guanosine(46)-N7)-methyltransferase TrmB [Gammaproteobacteria bacterium]
MVEPGRPSISSTLLGTGFAVGTEENRLTSRSVRSFVIRNGRLTKAQQAALENLLPLYGIPFRGQPISSEEMFGNDRPVWLEIGIGNGDALIHMASMHPEVNFIGVEVHAPGIGHALQAIEQVGLTNTRLIHHDAVEVLESQLKPGSLERILLFCPDPWHKKRHHKRRIVSDEFAALVASRLMPTGLLHCATDVAEYAHWMLEVLNQAPGLTNMSSENTFVDKPTWRANTRFEKRGIRLGHVMHDLLFQRNEERVNP